MSISGQNLSIVIVTLKSEKIIERCIDSLDKNIPIIVVENSDNPKFKDFIENRYKNVKCILSKENLGMGAGNNVGIKLTETDYVLILNPDVTLESNTLEEIFIASKNISNFSILSPISSDINFPNYGMKNNRDRIIKTNEPFNVDYIDGYSMLINKKNFKNNIYFDENFFLYLENNDLCKRVKDNAGSIFVVPKAKINHSGGKAVDIKFKEEIELSRNWHWVWSKFYFNKKNFSFFKAMAECLPTYISSILKFLFYSLINRSFKKKMYLNRASGFYNAFTGKPSWYRPKIDN